MVGANESGHALFHYPGMEVANERRRDLTTAYSTLSHRH